MIRSRYTLGILWTCLVGIEALAATPGDPVIGPRDVLDIKVYDEPGLSLTVVVSASGEFSFPLLRRVQVAGKTADELGLHMEQRLRDEHFLLDPSVSVILKEQNSTVVTLLGAVTKPGVVPIYPGMPLTHIERVCEVLMSAVGGK